MAIVCIDAGHGGYDAGACAFGRKEKDDVLKLSLKVRDALTKQGVKVVMTRTTDTALSIDKRCEFANNAKADYLLSIHRNAGGGKGYEIWVHSKATANTTGKAKEILDAVVAVNKSTNRGVKKGAIGYTDYGINKYSKMPSSILEMGFIDTATDNTEFDKFIDKYAEAIAKAICGIVGVEYVTQKVTKPAATTQTVKSNVKAGDTVTINKGAVYGGASRGTKVPTAQLTPKKHTVARVQVNSGIQEALLKEINSWVAVSSLTLTTATTAVKTVKKGNKVKVKKGAKSYEGKDVASFIYGKVYTVDELKGKRAVLGVSSICTAFNTDDLIVQ